MAVTIKGVTSYEGAVISLHSSYNSSMDYNSYSAVVWDVETQSIKTVNYGSNFSADTMGHATVDASDELRAHTTSPRLTLTRS